ncbi:uncharacterized protein BDV17DRAFT_266088 [Aspergillus undulatus]|uniref:uncharacterized protein n=1 Tax=Aspergillus undulatus TaxID=1810928 RepID=UPI003CCE2D05
MSGIPLFDAFGDMDLKEKEDVFAQMAGFLKALQAYQLPQNLTIGGVAFDGNGDYVSTAMTSVGAGPWPSYESSFKGRLDAALSKADANPYVQGWRANGIRERLDALVERGFTAQFGSLSSKRR